MKGLKQKERVGYYAMQNEKLTEYKSSLISCIDYERKKRKKFKFKATRMIQECLNLLHSKRYCTLELKARLDALDSEQHSVKELSVSSEIIGLPAEDAEYTQTTPNIYENEGTSQLDEYEEYVKSSEVYETIVRRDAIAEIEYVPPPPLLPRKLGIRESNEDEDSLVAMYQKYTAAFKESSPTDGDLKPVGAFGQRNEGNNMHFGNSGGGLLGQGIGIINSPNMGGLLALEGANLLTTLEIGTGFQDSKDTNNPIE